MIQAYTLYSDQSADPTRDAQRNLSGRSHYCDADTLRCFGSRVRSTHVSHGGTLFSIVESYSASADGTKRLCRFVTFDLMGKAIERCDYGEGWRTSAAARQAMRDFLATVDARAITSQALSRHVQQTQEATEGLARFVAAADADGLLDSPRMGY